MSKGLLLVISGFSGAGKGTVMKRLLELHDKYSLPSASPSLGFLVVADIESEEKAKLMEENISLRL